MSEKIKKYLKKFLLSVILFLVIFIVLFYILNLDFSPNKNSIVTDGEKEATSVAKNNDISTRLGSTTFSIETYSEWKNRNGLNDSNSGLDDDPDKDKLPNYLEYVHGTNPLNSDTDGDAYSDKQEIINGYDPDAPGEAKPFVEIKISKINIAAPVVWSKSDKEDDMLKDLENGINHYPKTASFGQNGNSVVSGHSSNYLWAKGDYNHIFKNLNDLEIGDIIVAKTIQANGRVIIYQYRVSDKFITSPDDERIFAPANGPVLTLSTCWPIGTTYNRLIIKTELVK
ncbi:MAG TPA: sortase [Candidatus Moranbacteria bacterium]|nr:sortase [Candidatus Moranbacteria bacterium]HRZ33813.1 sortase [Candidatus Moranbacteria bacterium]